MRWNSTNLITGMQSLFSSLSSQENSRPELTLNTIRHAMLEALGAMGASTYPVIQLRVSYANEIQDLWYLRGDVMSALAEIEGEANAKTKMTQISNMFRGLLPQGMISRPSPLSS
jgi:hypothetical protein